MGYGVAAALTVAYSCPRRMRSGIFFRDSAPAWSARSRSPGRRNCLPVNGSAALRGRGPSNCCSVPWTDARFVRCFADVNVVVERVTRNASTSALA
jgi:hypothetical protein